MHTSADIKLYIVKNKLYIDVLGKSEETLPSLRESEYLGMYSFKENPRRQTFQLIYNTANFYQYLKTLKAFQRVFFEKSLRTCRRGKKVGTLKTIFPISGLVLKLSSATKYVCSIQEWTGM